MTCDCGFSHHDQQAAVRATMRRGNTSSMLQWLMALVPTLLLVFPITQSLMREHAARKFLDAQFEKEYQQPSFPIVYQPTEVKKPVDDFDSIRLALPALRARAEYYGIAIESHANVFAGTPQSLAAMVRDAIPIYRRIEQDVDDKEKAAYLHGALAGTCGCFKLAFMTRLLARI